MENSVLSLTMRPKCFSDIIGLKSQVQTLKSKLAEGVPRGFLFTGPYGSGKTTLAYIVAREVQGWDFPPDLQPQVMQVNGANSRKIEDMRKMAQDASSYPMVGKYSVIILDEVHQLTKEAQQILLIELERTTSSTVWILATTDPEKLNQGVRDRCFTIRVSGMEPEDRVELVQRAAAELKHTDDCSDFVKALDKAKIVSPRKILMAFELFHNGLTAQQAIGAMSYEVLPEYFEIAQGIVYGKWESGYTLPWLKEKDGSAKKFNPVGEQLKALEEHLKGKPKAAAASEPAADDAEPDAVDEEDLQGKPDVARALRAIVAASLKNQVYKGGAKAVRASEALHILAHCCSPSAFDTGLEFAATIGGLFRVNSKIQSK